MILIRWKLEGGNVHKFHESIGWKLIILHYMKFWCTIKLLPQYREILIVKKILKSKRKNHSYRNGYLIIFFSINGDIHIKVK